MRGSAVSPQGASPERTATGHGPVFHRGLWCAALVLCLLLTAAHIRSGQAGPRWTSPILLGDHLFDLLVAGLIFLYSLAVGRRVCGQWNRLAGDALSDGLAGLGLGMGVLSLGILAMGALHLYYTWAVLAAVAGLTLWLGNDLKAVLTGWADAVATGRRAGLPIAADRWTRLTIVVLGLALAALWLQSLLPAGTGSPIEWDAPAYHLAGPKLFIRAHHLIPLPDIPLANAPSGIEMFYLLGLLLHTDGLGKTLNLLFIVLLCASSFTLARRHGHPRAGWLSVILLANVTWLVPEVPATLNDFAAAAMLVLGLNDALIWLEQQQAEPSRGASGLLLLARAGCLMGFSASFKLSNLPVAPAAAVTVGLVVLVIVKQSPARRLFEAVRAGFVVGACTLLTLSPWLLKAYILFGHPFYPMSVAISYTAPGHTGSTGNTSTVAGQADHVWQTVTSLGQVFTGSLGPLAVLILLAPLLVYSVGGRAMQVFLVAGGLLWIWFVPLYGEPRYYIPLIAIGAALAAAVICHSADRLPFPVVWSELPFVIYLLAHSLLMLALSSQQAINSQSVSVALGGISREAYLAAHVAPYDSEEWVNDHTPPDAVIALVHTTLGYYLDRDQVDDWYSARRLSLEAGGAARAAQFAAWCRAGARFAMVNRGDDHDAAFNLPMPLKLEWLTTSGLHAHLLYSASSVDVYAVTPCLVGTPSGARRS